MVMHVGGRKRNGKRKGARERTKKRLLEGVSRRLVVCGSVHSVGG